MSAGALKGATMNDEPEVESEQEQLDSISINIGNLNGGAVCDGFDLVWAEALKNIADLSTIATATRTLNLVIELKPHSDRITIETEISWKTKLAGAEKSKGKMFLGLDSNKALVAIDRDPRQLMLWTAPAPKEAPKPIAFRNSK
ncbi:MAG: hypothetical protein WB424_00015 [Terracidiphilus sp.]